MPNRSVKKIPIIFRRKNFLKVLFHNQVNCRFNINYKYYQDGLGSLDFWRGLDFCAFYIWRDYVSEPSITSDLGQMT